MSRHILVVGAGSIGERHVRVFSKIDGVEVSVCEIDRRLLNTIRDRYPLGHTFADWDAVPLEKFDAVVVCTPAHLHVAMIRRALERSCHVLCEKPLSVETDAVAELIEFAKSTDRVAAVAYVYRCLPALRALKEIIDAGTLGRIKQVVAFWAQEFPKYRPAYSRVYYRDHATGGGAIQDAVTHVINYIEWCLGPTSLVSCAAEHMVLPEVEVEDTAALILRFKNTPAIGTVVLNQFQKPDQGWFEFMGTETNARFTLKNWSVEVYDPQSNSWQGKSYPVYDRDELYEAQAKMFLHAIDTNQALPCSLEDAFATLKTIRAALRSSGGQETVRVED